MSLDEAHLILNVKKEDPLEVIQKVRIDLSSICARNRENSLIYHRITIVSSQPTHHLHHPLQQRPPNRPLLQQPKRLPKEEMRKYRHIHIISRVRCLGRWREYGPRGKDRGLERGKQDLRRRRVRRRVEVHRRDPIREQGRERNSLAQDLFPDSRKSGTAGQRVHFDAMESSGHVVGMGRPVPSERVGRNHPGYHIITSHA